MAGNTLVNQGRAVITAALAAYASVPKYIGWGTGTNATPAAATALTTPAAEARVAGTVTQTTGTTNNDTLHVTGTLTVPTGQSRAITEAGLFTDLAGSTLFVYSDFLVINLSQNDAIDFTFDVKFQ